VTVFSRASRERRLFYWVPRWCQVMSWDVSIMIFLKQYFHFHAELCLRRWHKSPSTKGLGQRRHRALNNSELQTTRQRYLAI